MMKYYFLLLAALLLLTSCADPGAMPMSHVPIGIQILAFVGLVAVLVLTFGFIIVFGGLLETPSFPLLRGRKSK